VSHVVKRVERMSMHDNDMANQRANDKEDTPCPGTNANDKPDSDNTIKISDKQASDNTHKIAIDNGTQSETAAAPPTTTTPSTKGKNASPTKTVVNTVDSNKKKKAPSWKRIQRNGPEHMGGNPKPLTTQGCSPGAPWIRPDMEEEDQQLQPMAKKIVIQVPSLEICLGKDNLAKLREEEERTGPPIAALPIPRVDNTEAEDANSSSVDEPVESPVWKPDVWKVDNTIETIFDLVVEKVKNDSLQGKKGEIGSLSRLDGQMKISVSEVSAAHVQQGRAGGMEASSLGAAGKLSGAKDSAWQDQC
jgi:hypothetical protein